ncbi:MAG TPA: FAD-dependent oxidoreductase, partial [Leptolinea sp.]
MDQAGLRQLEDQCIQEYAPACMATCPARVDARAICAEIAKGDFSAGLKIYRKAVPFPGIISRICDEPCRNACIRKDAGEAIAIAELERACADHGGTPEKPAVLPHRDKRLAVIGSGLCGLTAAYDMARKGYQVTVFEKADHIGGSILLIPDSILPLDIVNVDFAFLSEIGIQIELNSPVEKITPIEENLFRLKNKTFDAVFIGIGMDNSAYYDLEKNAGAIVIDPVTYATSIAGIFSGGGA